MPNSNVVDLVRQLDAAVAALVTVSADVSDFRALDEPSLLRVNQLQATAARIAGATGALVAGEIARRSSHELGSSGLARRAGHRTPEHFIKATTGATGQQAVTAVRIGVMMQDAANDGAVDAATGEVAKATQPWLRPVSTAVQAGELSISAAESISRGLGVPNSVVTAEWLEVVSSQLCGEANERRTPDGIGVIPGLDADALFKRARNLRDELDVEGVREREAERRARRSLTFTQLPDGTSRLVWVMDPETAATVKDLYDRATSPKRGGVRFADPERAKQAEAIFADERTPAQLASDVFEHLLRAGADADDSSLLGTGAPVIRIAATRQAVDTRVGIAHIEGQPDAVSLATLERLSCGGHRTSTTFDGQEIPLDHGREQRLFSRHQKDVLALKWGGCAAPGCERPPSWTEAHHIEFWQRDEGKTDIADGILFRKSHHLHFHNANWEVRRDDLGRYWLIPPPQQDAQQTPVLQTPVLQTPVLLDPRGGVMRDLRRERALELTG
jgi:hypothetical protein